MEAVRNRSQWRSAVSAFDNTSNQSHYVSDTRIFIIN